MHRFNALNITDRKRRELLTGVFTYEDDFIDDGLRCYTFKQALHLYLKQNGYELVVFYTPSGGLASYEREMLETFLRPIDEPAPAGGMTVDSEVYGRLRGGRLMRRNRGNTAPVDPVPNDPVPVNQPQSNLYCDNLGLWHTKGRGVHEANMSQMIYNIQSRRHMVLVIEASQDEEEFETPLVQKLSECLRNTEEHARILHNDNRVLILVQADSCRGRLMQLFDPQQQHPSVFMRGSFRDHYMKLTKDGEHHEINLKHVFALPQPTTEDVQNLMMYVRYQNGLDKSVDWSALPDICEQFALQDRWTLKELSYTIMEKTEFNHKAFEAEGIKRRGDSEASLAELVGLISVKEQIQALRDRMELAIERHEDISSINKHMVFYGNPGTGKTTVARIIAQIYKDLGLICKGHLVEVSREHLVAGYVGQTAIKTANVIDSALDGVLFIDEAYRLSDGGENDFGKEAIDTLLARMENDRRRLVVILAGYEKDMQRLYKLNEGLKSRFNTFINFPDYTVSELKEILLREAQKHYQVTPEVDSMLPGMLEYALAYKSRSNDEGYKFGNARWVRNLMEKVDNKVAYRRHDSDISKLQVQDFVDTGIEELEGWTPGRTNENDAKSPMNQLREMIGLQRVKEEVQVVANKAQYNQALSNAGITTGKDQSMHLVFSGSPGTGKTTVARLIGGIYRELGLLSSGHCIEIANRGMLIEGYQGQTAKHVNEVVDRARGGVLFIDEIYSLVTGELDSFGIEALNTLITRIENDRDDMVVILAGYEELMNNFFGRNPGLVSRFNTYVHFDDYSSEELTAITLQILQGKQHMLNVNADAASELQAFIEHVRTTLPRESGNGRWARNLAEKIVMAHSSRAMQQGITDRTGLLLCTREDIQHGIQLLEQNTTDYGS